MSVKEVHSCDANKKLYEIHKINQFLALLRN